LALEGAAFTTDREHGGSYVGSEGRAALASDALMPSDTHGSAWDEDSEGGDGGSSELEEVLDSDEDDPDR
jgi:hypothetical protein